MRRHTTVSRISCKVLKNGQFIEVVDGQRRLKNLIGWVSNYVKSRRLCHRVKHLAAPVSALLAPILRSSFQKAADPMN
jgi:hypothetical protein